MESSTKISFDFNLFAIRSLSLTLKSSSSFLEMTFLRFRYDRISISLSAENNTRKWQIRVVCQ